MPTRVWLLRHAQTDRPHIFHGAESDTELSDLGYRQAETIAPILASYRPEVLIASGMVRAQKTARPVAAACGLPLLTEPLLHERKVGELVGQPSQGEFGVWPDTLQRWLNGEPHFAPPGAESFQDIQNRVLPIWDRLMEEHRGKSIVVIAHGIVNRIILLSRVQGMVISDWIRIGKMHNVSISELVREEETWEAIRIAEVVPEIQRLNAGG